MYVYHSGNDEFIMENHREIIQSYTFITVATNNYWHQQVHAATKIKQGTYSMINSQQIVNEIVQ